MSQALDPVTRHHIDRAAEARAREFAGIFSQETIAQAEGTIVKEQAEGLFVCVHNAGRSQMAATRRC